MVSTGFDLGARGLVGLLTPRENPAAEPEMSVLLAPDVAMLASRMRSPAASLNERLVDYGRDLTRWLDAFGQAPLGVVGFACTGTSYLLDRPLPDRVRQAGREVALVTAAGAVEAALSNLVAKTLAVISPYPDDLTLAAVAYWTGRGFSIAVVERLRPVAGYHPIYGQTNAAALAAVTAARGAGCDAVLALGTGAPTLGAIAVALRTPGPPVMSSNLCMGWRLSAALADDEPLAAWLSPDAAWVRRLEQRFPAALARL
ncbi:MAG TPA: hypothetical protein VL460_09980 [Caulobacteraceae bacterium]|nr:hypothetical protein [Caulobacteraceae bacterium]